MAARFPNWLIDRRSLIASICANLTAFGFGRFGRAAEAPAEPSAAYLAVYQKVTGTVTPEDNMVAIDLPDIAENGNIVPYKLAVESPMTDQDYITKLHLLSTANPQPAVATFHFTPQSGKAAVSGRMRLAKTQHVVALAETSTGRLLKGSRVIEVTIGGCGN